MHSLIESSMDRVSIGFNMDRMTHDKMLEHTQERVDTELVIKVLLTRDTL
jgi:hypothetical protein